MKISNLEFAAQIYWSSTVDSDECILASAGNPESRMMVKEALEKLSEEAKLLVQTIVNLPDEAFYSSGKVIMRELKSWMARKYRWKSSKVDACRAEILIMLGEKV